MAKNETRSGYEDVDEIVDVDGVVAIMSRRKATGAVSFMLAKIYERDGKPERTSFMQRKHIEAARRVLDLVEAKMNEIEAKSDSRVG